MSIVSVKDIMMGKKHEIKIIEKDSDKFPQKLKQLKDCPDRIYVIGNEKILNDYMIAVIGARECGFESMKIARNISEGIAKSSIVIVSGFARGIDSVAHRECVKNSSKTIAVIGSGLENIYPKRNRELIDLIIENGGAIISEHSPEESPQKYYFSLRNRIIAALANIILVVEAKEKSGSLITVEYARKLSRPVVVVPGAIDDINYKGSNLLIKNGYVSVQNFQEFSKLLPQNDEIKIYSESVAVPNELLNVYCEFNDKGMSVNEICMKTNMKTSDVQYKLMLLEMQGFIEKNVDGLFYKK